MKRVGGGRSFSRWALHVCAACVLVAALWPGAARAQSSGSMVGVVGGWLSNRSIWRPESDVESVGGIVAGLFVLAPTPAPWFSFKAEGSYQQRGTNVTGTAAGQPFQGAVRTDYVSVMIEPRISFGLSRASVFFNAGAGIDQIVRSRVGSALAPILVENSTVFGVGVGAGVALRATDLVRVELEARLFEGLGDAYSAPTVSFRNRSRELVLGVAIPLHR